MAPLSNLKQIRFVYSILGLFGSLCTSPLLALFLDGSGHYGLRSETLTNPASAPNRGMHQATDQSFRLEVEARSSDTASFFMEFRLFDDPRNAYLGDSPNAVPCKNEPNTSGPCKPEQQSVLDPGYKSLIPKVTKFYLQYAFDYCILKAGRRDRDWGLGILLDSGKRPFSISASSFDGITCDVNLQKFQNLGFSVGWDRLAETGSLIRQNPNQSITVGPSNGSDDIDQYYLSIEYDDRKTHPNSFFNKQIGIYGANIKSGSISGGGYNTELSIADLYLAFYFPNLSFKNEFLFRIGKSADPHASLLGGASETSSGEIATNKLSSIGIAGALEWLLAGPSAPSSVPTLGFSGTRHLAFLEYAFAPGDSQGYYTDTKDPDSLISKTKRDEKASAVSFNPNFSPALILFNGRSEIDEMKVDGIFDPSRVMNAQVYSLGYRFESKDYGNIESKLITAYMNQGPSDAVKTYHLNKEEKPFGYYGRNYGLELDIKYWRTFSYDINAGVGAAALLPGQAWKVMEDQKPLASYLMQVYMVYNF